MKNSNKGFLLFEAVVSIVIITAGLLFVMHSYSTSKDSIRRSSEVFSASLLLEDAMWVFEQAGEIEEGGADGDFDSNEEYAWELDAAYDEELDLNVVLLEVFQKKHPKTTRQSVTTYLRNKEF